MFSHINYITNIIMLFMSSKLINNITIFLIGYNIILTLLKYYNYLLVLYKTRCQKKNKKKRKQ